MKRTNWYDGKIKPVREGWYERDYTEALSRELSWAVAGLIFLDLWRQISPGNGFWYVDEPKGEINDAFYQSLPWRGVKK